MSWNPWNADSFLETLETFISCRIYISKNAFVRVHPLETSLQLLLLLSVGYFCPLLGRSEACQALKSPFRNASGRARPECTEWQAQQHYALYPPNSERGYCAISCHTKPDLESRFNIFVHLCVRACTQIHIFLHVRVNTHTQRMYGSQTEHCALTPWCVRGTWCSMTEWSGRARALQHVAAFFFAACRGPAQRVWQRRCNCMLCINPRFKQDMCTKRKMLRSVEHLAEQTVAVKCLVTDVW